MSWSEKLGETVEGSALSSSATWSSKGFYAARLVADQDGIPWARIGEAVGHADLMTTAPTYTHILANEAEADYAKLLSWTAPGWGEWVAETASDQTPGESPEAA